MVGILTLRALWRGWLNSLWCLGFVLQTSGQRPTETIDRTERTTAPGMSNVSGSRFRNTEDGWFRPHHSFFLQLEQSMGGFACIGKGALMWHALREEACGTSCLLFFQGFWYSLPGCDCPRALTHRWIHAITCQGTIKHHQKSG